ncbi:MULTISPECIES: WYL domain-containing protein [Arthrobacter]|uniref:WYL domain-containing protein n=2 Tax=Arthrobacter TaxID=1663 RepID=A0ABU9KGD8_9MICC|nr:WYL domain-containing protein [Arthrobacter sp. YJM1]MDP5225951.1 WYL domain-containing protein [Arthrobacter sp. YJM1]
MSARKTERILNLLIALLSTRRGHTRAYLESTVYAYCREEGIAGPALERMFERDKAELRDMGVPLEAVVDADLDVDDSTGVRYRVSPSEYLLPELRLDAQERLLLQLAAQLWEQGSLRAAGSSALRKLADGEAADDAAVPPMLPRVTTGGAALEALHAALSRRSPVEFSYRAGGAAQSEPRRLHPYGLGNRAGQWYVVGLDLDRDAERTFRLGRITSDVKILGGKPFERPADFSIGDSLRRMEEYPAQRVTVALASGLGADWRHRAVVLDGDLAALEYRDEAALLDELSTQAAVAQVVSPQRLRDEVTARLGRAAAAMELPVPPLEFHKPPAKRGPRTTAESTVRRLLAMIPFLARHGGISKQELAAEFGITRQQLEDDLLRIMMVGRPEGYHDDLMDIVDDGDRVWIDNALDLSRPVRFSPEEAWTLLVGLEALAELDVAGDRDAVEQLRLRLGAASGDALELASAIAVRMAPEGREAGYLAALRDSIAAGHRVHIGYVVPSRDEVTERLIDPRSLRSAGQRWYVEAWCHQAEGWRNFRLDRITALRRTEEPVDPTIWEEPPGEGVFTPSREDACVTVVFARESRWLAGRYGALRTSELPDGGLLAELSVASRPWLAGLVALSGGEVRVVAPAGMVAFTQEWLREGLGRYRGTGGVLLTDGVPGDEG